MDNRLASTALQTRLARLPRLARLALVLAVLVFGLGLLFAALLTPPLLVDQNAPLQGDAATYAGMSPFRFLK